MSDSGTSMTRVEKWLKLPYRIFLELSDPSGSGALTMRRHAQDALRHETSSATANTLLSTLLQPLSIDQRLSSLQKFPSVQQDAVSKVAWVRTVSERFSLSWVTCLIILELALGVVSGTCLALAFQLFIQLTLAISEFTLAQFTFSEIFIGTFILLFAIFIKPTYKASQEPTLASKLSTNWVNLFLFILCPPYFLLVILYDAFVPRSRKDWMLWVVFLLGLSFLLSLFGFYSMLAFVAIPKDFISSYSFTAIMFAVLMLVTVTIFVAPLIVKQYAPGIAHASASSLLASALTVLMIVLGLYLTLPAPLNGAMGLFLLTIALFSFSLERLANAIHTDTLNNRTKREHTRSVLQSTRLDVPPVFAFKSRLPHSPARGDVLEWDAAAKTAMLAGRNMAHSFAMHGGNASQRRALLNAIAGSPLFSPPSSTQLHHHNHRAEGAILPHDVLEHLGGLCASFQAPSSSVAAVDVQGGMFTSEESWKEHGSQLCLLTAVLSGVHVVVLSHNDHPPTPASLVRLQFLLRLGSHLASVPPSLLVLLLSPEGVTVDVDASKNAIREGLLDGFDEVENATVVEKLSRCLSNMVVLPLFAGTLEDEVILTLQTDIVRETVFTMLAKHESHAEADARLQMVKHMLAVLPANHGWLDYMARGEVVPGRLWEKFVTELVAESVMDKFRSKLDARLPSCTLTTWQLADCKEAAKAEVVSQMEHFPMFADSEFFDDRPVARAATHSAIQKEVEGAIDKEYHDNYRICFEHLSCKRCRCELNWGTRAQHNHKAAHDTHGRGLAEPPRPRKAPELCSIS